MGDYNRSLVARLRNRNLPPGRLTDRRTFILERCAGRRVLHLGCVDWPFLPEKLESGNLLHSEMVERADRVVGVDSDAEGVAAFNARGWETMLADVEDFPELPPDLDLVVAGEIISISRTPAGSSSRWRTACPPPTSS